MPEILVQCDRNLWISVLVKASRTPAARATGNSVQQRVSDNPAQHRTHASSSSNFFASIRSAVSNPSVNQW